MKKLGKSGNVPKSLPSQSREGRCVAGSDKGTPKPEKVKENLWKRELEWKERMIAILDKVSCGKTEMMHFRYSDVYIELVKAHKKIYGKDHNAHWGMFGDSRRILNTYLLIRIFCMLIQTSESGTFPPEIIFREVYDENQNGAENDK